MDGSEEIGIDFSGNQGIFSRLTCNTSISAKGVILGLDRACLVPSHILPQLTLDKCGKRQKMWLANWLPHFTMSKGILSHFLLYDMRSPK